MARILVEDLEVGDWLYRSYDWWEVLSISDSGRFFALTCRYGGRYGGSNIEWWPVEKGKRVLARKTRPE